MQLHGDDGVGKVSRRGLKSVKYEKLLGISFASL